MRKKKKYILIRKIASFFFVLVIGVVFTLQGFCASPTKNYIKYDNVSITSQLFNSSGVSASGVSSCPMTNKDVWSNYFYSVPLFGTTSSGSFSVKIYIKDFFNNLSSDNTYHYHFTTGFTGGSSFYNLLGSTAYAYVNSQSFSVSKTSVSNGDSRFVFDFDLTGISGSSDLILQYYLSANSLYTASFLFSSYGEASYYTVVTGTDKVTSYLDQPVSPPANQGGTDTTISDYQQKEDQLTSNAAGVVSDLPGMISALDMSDFAGGFNLFNDLFTDFWSRSGKLKMIALFAIVSGSVMVILGLGVRGSRRLDPDKPPKEVIHKHYLAGKSKDNSSNKGSD